MRKRYKDIESQRESERRDARRRWARNRLIMEKAKESGCQTCGEMDPIVLHFHHIDASTKSSGVARMIGGSAPRMLREIGKCAIVCANCHERIHARAIDTSILTPIDTDPLDKYRETLRHNRWDGSEDWYKDGMEHGVMRTS